MINTIKYFNYINNLIIYLNYNIDFTLIIIGKFIIIDYYKFIRLYL